VESQIQGWVLNRFYYQANIPIKDAAILSNCPDRDEITSLRHVLPGVRFAVDAYVRFARERPWQEAVCASLTELFAPTIHQKRVDDWPRHYPWIERSGYDYFKSRLTQARRDVEHGLEVTLSHFDTRELQNRALEILQFKLDLLWSMLDTITLAYCDVEVAGYGRIS
jgi:pyrroloquinoline-quinone synthase